MLVSVQAEPAGRGVGTFGERRSQSTQGMVTFPRRGREFGSGGIWRMEVKGSPRERESSRERRRYVMAIFGVGCRVRVPSSNVGYLSWVTWKGNYSF